MVYEHVLICTPSCMNSEACDLFDRLLRALAAYFIELCRPERRPICCTAVEEPGLMILQVQGLYIMLTRAPKLPIFLLVSNIPAYGRSPHLSIGLALFHGSCRCLQFALIRACRSGSLIFELSSRGAIGSVISSSSSDSNGVDDVLKVDNADDRLLESLLAVDDRRLVKSETKLTDMMYGCCDLCTVVCWNDFGLLTL